MSAEQTLFFVDSTDILCINAYYLPRRLKNFGQFAKFQDIYFTYHFICVIIFTR